MTTPEAFFNSTPIIMVNGEERGDVSDALGSMVVNQVLRGSAHAELSFSNWGTPEGGQEPDFLFADILPGAEIDIQMRQPDPVVIFSGEVTAIEEEYGEGAPLLTLLLQDKLHRLARKRQNRVYEEQSPDDVIQALAGDLGLSTDVQVSGIVDSWHQINESDLAFMLRICDRFDISPRISDGSLRARSEESDSAPVELSAQDNAIQVRLTADLNHQPKSSISQGYNLATGEAVDHSSNSMTPAPSATSAADTLSELSWEGEEIIPQPFARSVAEAEAYAKAHFRRQARRFIQGDIICQGDAALRSGREVELSGVSPRLSGRYQVAHCTHRFDRRSGFETHIKVNRSDWSPA
ncbi:phage late control D family protein [Thalassolituus sp.]|uniref:phage late control D family protein n=1 Tax=Thalassolituus sp. TaxID=2030822 RepID=UPI003518655D